VIVDVKAGPLAFLDQLKLSSEHGDHRNCFDRGRQGWPCKLPAYFCIVAADFFHGVAESAFFLSVLALLSVQPQALLRNSAHGGQPSPPIARLPMGGGNVVECASAP